MKRNILILLALFTLQVAYCQNDPHIFSLITIPVSNDTVSVDEMKNSFYSSLKEINEKSYDDYDLFFLPYSPRLIHYIIPSQDNQSLHKVGKMLLPASQWKWLRHHGKDSLYWAGFRTAPTNMDTTAIRKKLRKAYGAYKYDGVECIIPAKWFSGKIRAFTYPKNYKNMNVNNNVFNIDVAKGVIKRQYYSERTFGSLNGEVCEIVDAIFIHSNSKTEERDSHYELFIFQHDINRLCQEDTTIKNDIPYSFLISVDGNQKAHIHTLLPTTLTQTDSLRIRELTKAVEAQPKGIFGTMWTIDGRVFPGRYLMTVYTRGGWKFKDYRYKDGRPGLYFNNWKEPL